MAVADGEGRVPWCSPTKPGSCADITHARQSGLVGLLAGGPAAEIIADAGHQGLVSRSGDPVAVAADAVDDLVCGFGPFEGPGL
ncbi:hypothetical protein ACFY88_39110, partial [Streptomyces sp. NPDC012616]